MKILIILALLGFTKTEITENQVCISKLKYEKEVLRENVTGPYQMVIDYNTNTLFFSYAARVDEYFKIAHLNLKTNQFGLVSGIRGGFASAVDNTRNVVYMGGENGVYTYNYQTKAATRLDVVKEDTNIWQMFYKDGLYFTTYPDEKAFLYKDGHLSRVSEIAKKSMIVGVSKIGNIYYSNSSGIFFYDIKTKNTVELGDTVANGFTTDVDGNLYFSEAGGVYYIYEKEHQIEKLITIADCYGVAIEENGDIIYSQDESITRLKKTNEKC